MTNKTCSTCGKDTPKLVKGDCQACYAKKRYRELNPLPVRSEIGKKDCPVCGNRFEGKNMTCSKTCAQKLNGSKSNNNRNFGEGRCAQCQKYFTIKATNQNCCSLSCTQKANRLRHAEYYKEKDRIRVTKQRIGLNIRDETLKTPSKDAKWLWDGIGKWSVKYWPDIRECLECGTTVYKHAGNGICAKCYDKLRPRTEEEVKEWKKKSYEKAKEAGKEFSAQQAKKWVMKAKAGEIPVTSTIENLLHNHDQL